ncbi:MAG TPA: DUF4193 family protein [Actinomycetota bacterium]|nr:DUF4193 family protein [Actinomycetota bacterium]
MSEIFEEPEAEEEDEDEELEDGEDEEEDLVEPASIGEASLEEILSKRGDVAEVEEEEDSLLDLTPDERMETLSIRPVPKQANEFVCSNCHLVKHQSQLADPARQLCRDCV